MFNSWIFHHMVELGSFLNRQSASLLMNRLHIFYKTRDFTFLILMVGENWATFVSLNCINWIVLDVIKIWTQSLDPQIHLQKYSLGPAVCSEESQVGLELRPGEEEAGQDGSSPSNHPGAAHAGEHGGEDREGVKG